MTDSGAGDVEQLRHEVEALKQRNEELEARTEQPPSRHVWRRIGAVILIVLASVLAPISTLGVWLRNTVTDTDRYVETIEPLVDDPAIQSFVAARVTQRLFEEVDVQSAVAEALPERATFLSGALTSGLQTVVTEAANRLIASDQFQELWVAANRLAQEQLVAVLTGEPSGVITTKDGVVSLDLSGIASAVVTQLRERGIDLFDSVNLQPGEFTIQLFQSDLITRVQVAFDAFDTLATVLPWITILLFAGGILLFPNRRRGAVWAAVGLSLGMAFLLLALAIGRTIYLGAIPSADIPQDVAATMFDTLVRFLRQGARALLAVGVVALLVLIVMGPGRNARRLRAGVARMLGRVGDEASERGVDFGPVGQWIGGNLTALRIAVAIVAAVVLVVWEQPTATVVFVVALVGLLVLGLIEILGRGGRAPAIDREVVKDTSSVG
jgi:hypothetical protein